MAVTRSSGGRASAKEPVACAPTRPPMRSRAAVRAPSRRDMAADAVPMLPVSSPSAMATDRNSRLEGDQEAKAVIVPLRNPFGRPDNKLAAVANLRGLTSLDTAAV